MILFLLPLIFSPFSLFAGWLPALYLAIWPIIIQTMGRETLLTHALVLVIFILTCDITRQTMLKLIGFDLISFPIGLALLAALVTDKGSLLLSLVRPFFSGMLIVIEPIFLLIEIYLIMDMIRSFNRWISTRANARDENSQDLSSWEPPLTRGSIVARIFVILITVSSYFSVYFIIQESKSLLGFGDDIPVNFNHAIAALVTLQLIAFSATIYKEEGILSESALVALLASIPIFIASWSYFHLKESANMSSSSWTSYFPFSLFATTSTTSNNQLGHQQQQLDPNQLLVGRHESSIFGDTNEQHHYIVGDVNNIDFGSLEQSVNRIEAMDEPAKQLLLTLLRRLIMIINSILGLSMDKLAKYYFGPDFWYILVGRIVCLFWWALISLRVGDASETADGEQWQHNRDTSQQQRIPSVLHRVRSIWLSFTSKLPITKGGLVKVLLVLAYTQMLIQQMDNRQNLNAQVSLLADDDTVPPSSCCRHQHNQEVEQVVVVSQQQQGGDMAAWFNCMWTSAKACSAGSGGAHSQDHRGGSFKQSRASRFWALIRYYLAQTLSSLTNAGSFLLQRYLHLSALIYSVYPVWLARWRSPIVQRLCQSMLVQVYYISSVLFEYE